MNGDAFDVLGLTARFGLDAEELQRAYLRRAREVHPDHGAAGAAGGGAGPGGEGAIAELNAARAKLADPERRARVLLARLGIGGGGAGGEGERALPAGFLMEIMEAREAMEAARAAGDEAGLDRWLAWAEERRAGHMARVGVLLDGALARGNGEKPAVSAAELSAVQREMNAWRYIERMIEQLGADAGGGL